MQPNGETLVTCLLRWLAWRLATRIDKAQGKEQGLVADVDWVCCHKQFFERIYFYKFDNTNAGSR